MRSSVSLQKEHALGRVELRMFVCTSVSFMVSFPQRLIVLIASFVFICESILEVLEWL